LPERSGEYDLITIYFTFGRRLRKVVIGQEEKNKP